MSNSQFAANVIVDNNPTYSLEIKGLTQGHIDRLYAILNHRSIMDFLEDKESRYNGPFVKAREGMDQYRSRIDFHKEFHKHLVNEFGGEGHN